MTCILKELTSTIRVQRFAVVGKYSDNRPFVRHAAMLSSETELNGECLIGLSHIGPPINNSDNGACHLIGQIGLTNEEIEAIEDWLASVETQYTALKLLPFQQYVITPHMVWVHSEEGRRLRQRFNCVGYVIEAYVAAEILLVDADSLPHATMNEVEAAYPDLQRIVGNPQLAKHFGFVSLAELGLTGDGPWKIAFPGYLFHSTHRFDRNQPRPGPFVPTSLEEICYPTHEI
jgi:hypothetical protein